MEYVGLHTQQQRNNMRSVLLLVLFPCLIAFLTFLFFYLLFVFGGEGTHSEALNTSWELTLQGLPYVFIFVGLWFIIAYFANTSIIKAATHSHTLERTENKRVYNLVENLCISKGMKMPMVNVIEDNSLNAFASGINDKTYTVTLTRGIINELDDDELEGVIAHELSHIRNRDVRLLIVSIVFVGIFAMLSQIALRMLTRASFRSSKDKKGGAIFVILLVVVIAAIGYLFATLMRFAISRKREYMADAGAAEMTKNPLALASALRKVSGNSYVEARDDVAQLFIEHPKAVKNSFKGLSGLFASHPPIEKRIQVLEQF